LAGNLCQSALNGLFLQIFQGAPVYKSRPLPSLPGSSVC
jgi:hypothetical protein